MITCTRCQKVYPPDPRPGRSRYPGPHLCALQEGTQGMPGDVIELDAIPPSTPVGRPMPPAPPVHYAHTQPDVREALVRAWNDGYTKGAGDMAAHRPLDRPNPYRVNNPVDNSRHYDR